MGEGATPPAAAEVKAEFVAGAVPNPPRTNADKDEAIRLLFRRALTEHWKKLIQCPVCDEKAWTILQAVDMPLRYIPGRAFTFIPVECDTCRYTMFFNGVSMGLFEEGEPKEYPQDGS